MKTLTFARIILLPILISPLLCFAQENGAKLELPVVEADSNFIRIVPLQDPLGKPLDFRIFVNNLTAQSEKTSQFPYSKKSERVQGVMDIYTRETRKGLSSLVKQNEITYTYSNFVNTTVGNEYGTVLEFVIPYKIEKSTETAKLIFARPTHGLATVKEVPIGITPRLWGGILSNSIGKEIQFEKDFLAVFHTLTKADISQPINIEGAIDVNYPPTSIIANFLRRGARKFDQDPSRISFQIENELVNISVQPFRNGSKVLYQARTNWLINSNGADNGEKVKQLAKNLSKEISQIVNE